MQQENNSGEVITPATNNLISKQNDMNGESKNAAAIEDMPPTTTQKQTTFKKGHRRARSMPSHQVAKNGPKNFGHEQSIPNQV